MFFIHQNSSDIFPVSFFSVSPLRDFVSAPHLLTPLQYEKGHSTLLYDASWKPLAIPQPKMPQGPIQVLGNCERLIVPIMYNAGRRDLLIQGKRGRSTTEYDIYR